MPSPEEAPANNRDRVFGPAGRAIERFGDSLAWLFFAAFVISVVEVAMRYALNRPTNWVHSTSTAMCVAAFAIGGAYAMVRNEHMRVTVLVDRLKPGVQRASHWLSVFCGIVYLAGLSWGLGREGLDAIWRFSESKWIPELTPGPPNWPLPAIAKGTLFAGAVLFLLAVIRHAFLLARAGASKSEALP